MAGCREHEARNGTAREPKACEGETGPRALPHARPGAAPQAANDFPVEGAPVPQTLAHEVFPEGFRFADMHCHLDFSDDMAALARTAQHAGIAAFSNTVTPEGYMSAQQALAGFPNVAVGVGLHPWWVADGRCGAEQVGLACELAHEAHFVGEVGLDFAPHRAGSFEAQLAAFEAVMGACCEQGGKVVSIHAVRSATAVLDVLERLDAASKNACVLHWFSGTSQELARARELGCYFSAGPAMLATKRGRAYARQMPAERLLLETDLPEEGEPAAQAAPRWLAQLEAASTALREALRPR